MTLNQQSIKGGIVLCEMMCHENQWEIILLL